MKKGLGILLALAIVAGAFAGLTLLSVSAVSRAEIVDGEYLFEDFESGTAGNFAAQLGGTIGVVKQADGAPTYGGSEYSLKFSGGSGAWTTPGIKADAVGKVVNGQAGTYVLSAWVYFKTMPSDSTAMKATWRAEDGTNAMFTSGELPIEQGKWMFVSFVAFLNETWAAKEGLYAMFDGVGKGSEFYVDNVSFAKLSDTFIGTWYYSSAGAAFTGSGAFTGKALPAENNKVSFTFYNLNDIDVNAQIELRKSNWDTVALSGVAQTLLPIPAYGSATIELDLSDLKNKNGNVATTYEETDFWIVYMKQGSRELSGSDYTFGMELTGAAEMSMFQKTANVAGKAYYPVLGKITNNAADKGSVASTFGFGDTIVYGVQDTLTAETVDGCAFDGWYAEGNKVSDEAEYTVDTTDMAAAPRALEVKFSGTPAPFKLGDGTLETGMDGWTFFLAASKGTTTWVDGGANNTNKAIKYVPGAGNRYGALGFNVGPAVIDDEANRYAGTGADTYNLSFYARLADDAAVDSGQFSIFLNSQYHKSAGDLATAYGGSAADYVSTYTNYTAEKSLTFTKEWQKFEIKMEIPEKYVEQLKMLYNSKGVSSAYDLLIRIDGSDGIFATAANQTSGYLIDELVFEKAPEPTPTPTPTATVTPTATATATPTATPSAPADEKKVVNGDAENGLTGWNKFLQGGGSVEIVEPGANNTGHAVKFNAAGKYDSIAFDLGPAIVQNKALGYNGAGAGKYEITFWAKIDGTSPADAKFNVILNSQAHFSKADLTSKLNIAAEDWHTGTWITGPTVTLTGQWQKFTATIDVSENYLKTLDAIYAVGEKGAHAYELILRLDGSSSAFAGDTTFPYLVDEVSIQKTEAEKEPVGVKWTFTKDFANSPYFCSTAASGFITKADVKDGKVKKNITIYNTGSEDIEVQFSATVLHKGATKDSWEAVKNTEKTVIPAGKSLLIEYECDANPTINVDGKEAVYTYDQFFPRFDIRNKDGGADVKAGTEFIISGIGVEYLDKLESNAKSSLTKTMVYELPASGNRPGGDVLPVAMMAAAAVAAVISVAVAVKKRKEQE